MRRNGGLFRSEVFEPSATQAKGMWDIHDQYHAKLGNNWPQRKEIITFADANGVTTFTEGQSLTINIVTNGYIGAYYTIGNMNVVVLFEPIEVTKVEDE